MKETLPCEKEVAISAKKLVESFLRSATHINLLEVDRDKYFRILADVAADGKSLKDVLLSQRVAYQYERQTKEKINWCDFNHIVR